MAHIPSAPSGDQLAPPLVSVNWHIWAWCNYECIFCFAHFADISKSLDPSKAREILGQLAEAGTQKITFAGGEPTLCPWLDQAIVHAKSLGMTTMIVSNGTGVTRPFLEATKGSLDYVTLSIDSPDDTIELKLGRGRGAHVSQARQTATLVREFGVRLKVNTVVTRANLDDDMHELIREIAPMRWKVFQMLPILGENEEALPLAITPAEFAAYIERHEALSPVAEDNDAMTASYVMMDPIGRFFQNEGGAYARSRSVLEVGVAEALADIGLTRTTIEKMAARGGIWSW